MKLFPYQELGVEQLVRWGCCGLLADEQGLGKTVQVIRAADRFPDIKRVLILCPASLKINWLREWKLWSSKRLSVGIAYSDSVPPTDVVIVNYDIVERNGESLTAVKWDLVVCDEAHMIRSPSAKRTQRVLGLGCKGLTARRKLLVTGTPIMNRPIDIYPFIWWLNPFAWGSYEQFGERYCESKERVVVLKLGHNEHNRKLLRNARQFYKTEWDAKIKPNLQKPFPLVRVIGKFEGAKNIDELAVRLSGLMLRRLKKDVLPELPPKIRQVIELDPTDTALALLNKEHEMWQHLKDMAERKGEPSDWASVARSSDTSFLNETRRDLAMSKVPLAVEFIDNALTNYGSEGKVVLFGYHIEPLDRLEAYFKQRGVGVVKVTGYVRGKARQEAVDNFQNDPSCRIFLGQYNAAGVGLTLTSSNHYIAIEPDWTPSVMVQAEDRLHRISQKSSVLCQYLVYAESIECAVLKAAIKKQEIIEQGMGYTEELHRILS